MEITNLVHSYGHFADAGETEAFAALFADGASIDIGKPGVNDSASLKTILERQAGPRPQTRHLMTNLLFRSQSESEAVGACYLIFTSTADNRLTPMATGQYTFTVAKRDGGWRIQHWRVELDSTPG